MSFWAVVFVVLMLFWLFSGYMANTNPPPPWAPFANSLIPWLCVAILGAMMFGGLK